MKNRYEAIHLEGRSDTIIYDTKHEEPILSLPRHGYETILEVMNERRLMKLEAVQINKRIKDNE